MKISLDKKVRNLKNVQVHKRSQNFLRRQIDGGISRDFTWILPAVTPTMATMNSEIHIPMTPNDDEMTTAHTVDELDTYDTHCGVYDISASAVILQERGEGSCRVRKKFWLLRKGLRTGRRKRFSR